MKQLIRQPKLQRLYLLFVALVLGVASYQIWFTESASASGEVDQVWRNVQNSDSYAFTASIENKTIPMPTVSNIGRFSKTDTLYLEGENNLRDEELLLALWGGGVNVLDQNAAYQMRLADGQVETRVGEAEWQAGDDRNVGFAPGGDFLAFLDVATDVQVVAESATDVTPDSSYTIYQFNVDGPAYAQRLTRISQEHLVQTNQLPAGVALQVPEHLQNLTGNGELWVDGRGLPVREIVTLNIPAAANTDYRTEAILDVQFTRYEGVSLAAIWSQPGRVIGNILAHLPLPTLPELGFSLTALLGVSLFMVIIMRPNRRTQQVVFSVIVAMMLFTPLAQAQAASEKSEQIATFKAEQEEVAAAQNTNIALPYAEPTLYTPPATPNQQPSTLDTDEDGLTDAAEELIGTSRLHPDSDFDGITDRNEIIGFTLGGQIWYGNPTVADSNNDSVLDGQEWNVDTDGDNTPDLYDFDDDGDGVPDKVDISRLVASRADNGTAVTFTAANPLQLTLTGLNSGNYTYVDLQLRPTNPDRLWYAFNVLNWPKDEEGNMQDWDNATFFDYCVKNGGTDCVMSPDDNGDIKFVPMLEVTLPNLSNLPRTSGGQLDQSLLDKYGISIQPAGNGSYYAYVPLNLVEDPVTGAKVAFQAKLVYQAGATWTPQQARLVWTVTVLNEKYEDADAAATTIRNGGGVGQNQTTVLHAYNDDFHLTGLNVHESHSVAMAIVYEDPAVDTSLDDDDGLMQMTQGLDNTFFVNRDCDFVNNDDECVGNGQRDITINEIYNRWNHPTNTGITDSQRWGIPDQLRVETHIFPSEDHALFQVGGQIAPNILTTRFQGSGVQVPNLLFVRENRFRALNADIRSIASTVTWNGQAVTVDFRNETETVTVGYNMAPYRYNTAQTAWEAFPLADYADHVRASFAATDAGLSTEESTPEVVQASALVGTINVMVVNSGQSAIISTNGSSGQHYILRPGLFEGVNLSDDALRADYLLAINTTADRLIQFVRFANRDLFTFDDYTNLFRTAFNPNQVFANEYDSFIEKATLANKTKSYTSAFLVFNSVLLLAGLSSIIAMNVKGGKIAGEAIALSVNAVGAVIEAATTITQINQIVIKNNPTANSLVLKAKTLAGWYSFNHVTTKLAAVGMVIGLAITWIVFFAAWGTGGLAVGSIGFNTLLATTIASTLVIVITFFVSLTVVGAIVLAIFAIFDLLAFIICKAGAKGACDIGITAAITQALTDWIYQGEVMIDLSGKPPISNIDDLKMKLTNPEQGLVVGNSVRFQADMFTLVRHNWPKPSVVYHYGSFYTAADLQSSSVVYSLTTSKTTLNTERGRTTWFDAWPYDTATALVPSPGVGWLIPLEKSKVLWQAGRTETILSPVYDFTTPQINREFPLWLNTGMALPSYDCWFSVCSHKTVQAPNSTDLTGKFVLDILPNSITGFYNWNALGTQSDFDGDGIPRAQDPNDTRWDTDSDGVPDKVEIEYGSSPTLTDRDGDGLNDALEIRYSTNPNQRDTDGDGLTDAQEVNGYLVTIAGYTFRITSDPLQRDADKDGISDGTEYRLNQLDPVLFPFHPEVFNDSPVRLYTNLSDADRVLAVSAQTIITTTVFNGLPQDSLLAGGRFTSTLPVELGGTTQARNFTLLPSGGTSIVQNGTAIAGSTNVTVTTSAAADVVAVGTLPSAPFTDIILDNPVGIIIDNDNPSAPTLTLGNFVEPGVEVIIGGTASDPTSYVALVEVSVNGGAYSTATGTSLWAFPVSVPNQPTGSIPIAVRVTDAVGHTRTGNFSLTIDGVEPITTLDLSAGQTRVVRRNADGNWTMTLAGNSSDALAGIDEVSVQIGSSRAVTVTDPAGAWMLVYPFDDIAFNNDPNPTGPITMTVTTKDNALPTGNAVTQIVPFVVDMTPPTVDFLSHGDDFQLTDGIVLTGTVQDEYTAVSGLEIAFVSAETVFATSKTWLHLPLNDLPETVQFNNVGGQETQIYCLDATCPTSYVSGTDGTAAAFDGNDILRSFEDLTLPATGRTIALWFNTTCANCGLFSSVQGDFPTLTEHDHDLFLDDGKVCVSFITGPVTRELRCSVTDTYNDGQWHQIVHTLGTNGNNLYVDGELAVSSPTTDSTFTTPDGVLVGHSPAAATPHFTGRLDDVVVYDGDMNATVATSLYRQWQPVTLIPGATPLEATWAYTVPLGIEGYYQVDMRAADTIGNRSDSRGEWPQFRGPIDTKPPTFEVSVGYSGSGSAAQTLYSGLVHDANLTTTDYAFVCDLTADQLRYETDATELEFTQQENARLTGISAICTQNGFQSSQISMRACDAFGHCAAAVPPQTIAYVGTSHNQLKPFGSLPNGIERTVLSDPQNRAMLIARPGQIITDIAIDEAHGQIYWSEMNSGAYNQPASIWRANLDGSNVEEIIPGLSAYAPEALQIALDPVGNKLYWTQGYRLWWANLDGTLPQAIYAVPDDPGFVGGNRDYHHIGDVAVDLLNGRLILSERRLRFDRPVPGVTIFNHSLIVTTQLNGTSPQFIAGVGPGCTYANFYQNVGSGIDPTLCVDQTGGMDVESVAAANGTAYWTAVDPAWTGSAVYGQPFGGTTFTIAPLELNSSYPGLRSNPLPHLYIPQTGTAVYVSLAETIVRGETGGEFSIFSHFRDETPAPVGTQARLSSQVTALTVTYTEQAVQTQPDLAVGMTSPALVLLDGDSSRYDVVVRNHSGLPADSTELTLNLPSGATFAGSNGTCSAASTTVTCDLGRFPAFDQQTISISFTISASTLTQLSAAATIASATTDANPNDNNATSNSITAAPTIAALPGVPYIYYSTLSELVRVPLLGDPNPEPIQFDNGGSGGVIFAIDNERGYVFINNVQNQIARVNLDGTGYIVIGNANPGTMPTQDGELSIAVDTASGRVYWTEVVTMVYTRIRSANPDGSDVQTIVPIVYGQKGLLFDPIRNLLYWVGLDSQQRQYVIYRSNPDGSDVQVVHTAAAGAQIRNLALDPYAQKLYWLDGVTDDGTLFWADSDGGNLAALDSGIGTDARGLVVLPAQNTIYYSKYGSLYQAELDGNNQSEVVWLGNQRYYGVSNLNPAVFPFIYINPPQSNLAFGLDAPFAASPCAAADPNELNDTPATATTLTAGIYAAALCRSSSDPSLGPDKDVYQIVVPAGQAITATLSSLPANYGLYIQRGDFTVDVSNESGTTDEQVIAANYEPTDAITYTLTVFSSTPGNNFDTYQLDIDLGVAPPNGYTDAQCLAVDPNDLPGEDGNHTFANATPLTVGAAAQGALCYENDSDFYRFTATAGQVVALDLPVRPADYSILLYAPDGSFRQAFTAPNYAQQVTLDVAGEWRVLVRDNVLTPTNIPYQLLVTDLTCSQNDAYEPNNVAVQAADLTGVSRVFASLCAAADLDFYTFQSGANQQLTLNYPANPAHGTITLFGANGELGRLDPGAQGKFDLSSAGWYTLTVANSELSGTDALYMFQWQVGAPPVPNTGTPYVYYTDAFHFTRVALSDDHIVEPLLVDAGALTWDTLATDPVRGWLYFFDLNTQALMRSDLYGTNPQTVIANANPDGISVPHVAIAVDEDSGRIYWLQPTGASASTASFIMRSNGDGSGAVQVVGNGTNRHSLVVDPIKGYLYWTENDTIRRSDLDGNGVTTLYTATSGNQIRDLTLDPYAQRLYWMDPNQQTLFRADSDGTNVTALVTGLSGDARGVALQPLDNALFYSNGTAMMRAQLDGSGAAAIATLSGLYQGPSNLDPGTFLYTPIGTPGSSLAFGYDGPIVSPCVLADTHEPNNNSGTATPLTVITQTVATGALCNTVIPNPTDQDYYHVTLADQKVLTVTLTALPADYRLVVIHPNGYAAAFSDNSGLSDEIGVISNTSGVPVEYDILVMSGTPVQNYGPYQITLTLGDVPPPPNPDDADCYYADPHDAPAPGGNGTIGTATDLMLDGPVAAALCYSNDVDMYGFDGLNGQRLTVDLPIRPDNYTLTLYDPSGTAWATPAYGSEVTLDASGRWTIAVSHVPLTPTTDQYQLLVTDESCVSSDSNEPNDGAGQSTLLSNGSRVRASLCSDSDVDNYRIWAVAGQQLTLNYPVNNTGSTLTVNPLGTVNSGTQGQFAIASTGWVTLTVSNNTLSQRAVSYLFQLALGTPPAPTSDTAYVYYSNASDLTRIAVITRTIEPILMGNGTVGGTIIASDLTRGKLYILDAFERIVRINFDGTGHEIIIPDADPNNILRFANSLAVDENSGRIYWMEPQFGVVTNLMSANGDGTDVQTLVTDIANEQAIVIDPVAGWVYWVQHSLYSGDVVDQIRRANLDGSEVTVVYAAPAGREIRDLAVDPYTQKLYWLDPAQRQLLWANKDGTDVAALATALNGPTRGVIVRPLSNELYYTSGLNLLQATLDGSNSSTIARLEGSYFGVSNLDPGVFYLTAFTTPSSNLVLGLSVPFAQPCTDVYEPNNTPGSAAAISTGSISSVLCTVNANQPDTQDYYEVTVPDGQQVDVTLTDLPQNYGLGLLQNGTWVDSSYVPGLVDEAVAAINESGSAAAYTILVERFGDTTSSNVPYTLTVSIGTPPPPPPPPSPPGDPCADVDLYDAPGALGNGSQANATAISFNTTIAAALCYNNDADYYTFNGVIGQNVTVDLPVRPANYYVLIYKPDGSYFNGIFPGSGLTYGDSITLNESGAWKVSVWQPGLIPTTDQYQLLLSVNITCSGLDPYEPNNEQGSEYPFGASPPATLSAMLCETSDTDLFTFDVVVGQRVRITPRVMTPGMEMIIGFPNGGFGFTRDPIDSIMRNSGQFTLGLYSQEPEENLPYEIDIQVDPVPTPTPLPNNWSCTTYPSTDIPQPIDDLTTVGSTVMVPASGTVTHVGIRDITFDHGGLWNLSFSLGAPNGTTVDMFSFDATGDFYVWCGGSNCQMSLDDGAIPGLIPPQFPNDGGTFQPNLNSFAPFNGLSSQGTWTLFVTDNFAPEPGDSDAGDTTGDLFSWELEVCVDNGNPPDPTPTPSPTSTPLPQPTSGTPTPPAATNTPPPTPTATATSCAVNVDTYESDDTAGTATLFDMSTLTSGNHTFHTFTDKDWMSFSAIAGREYAFRANKLGTNAPVSLAIYRSDGTTLEVVYTDEVSFTPTVTGDYYLVAGAVTGTSLPCNASYNIALTVTNPDATPIPTPIGTPAPPDHDRPPVSSAIITPTNGSAVTTIAPVTVEVGLAADSGIGTAVLHVNGITIDSYTAPPSLLDTVWQPIWTPTQTGVYTLTAHITATNGMTATSPVSLVYVDTANPSVSITVETITQAALREDGLYGLHGTASDDSRVRQVEVQIGSGPWQEAVVSGNSWLLPIAPLAQANPNGGTLAITVRATDMAGRIATDSANLTLDVVPPDPFTMITSLTSGVLISPTQITTGLDSRLTWPVISGTVNIYAGWSAIVTPTLGTLTMYGAAAGSHDQTQVEATVRYGHVVAVDANGNETAMTSGPFYFDTAQTPDLISNLNVNNWTDSGGKQVGQMSGTDQGTQKLFAGWNASHLRLRWNGVNVDGNGDLYFYLGTTAGGSTDLFNPFGPDDPGVLPFAADYVIHVSTGMTATLYTAGSGWTVSGPVAVTEVGNSTDVLIPLADLGIATPASASLQLLGVASDEATLNVWATLPDKNLKQPSWTQYIQWGSLGSGLIPANGVWADASIEAAIAVYPDSIVKVGAGDTITLTLTYSNTGTAPLPQLTLDGTGSGGFVVNNGPQTATNIPPGGSGTVTLLGVVNTNGTVAVTLADSYHRPYALGTFDYTLDTMAPVSITIALDYVGSLTNTIKTMAEDESPLATIEVEIDDGLPFGPTAVQIVTCVPGSGTANAFECNWNAGMVTDGHSYTLRGRATDIHGNVSGWSNPLTVIGDATVPVLAIGTETQTALSDNKLGGHELVLEGTLVDERAAATTQVCLSETITITTCYVGPVLPAPDNTWSLALPGNYNGITGTLSIVGFDKAGNPSTPFTQTVWLDTISPVISTTVAPDYIQMIGGTVVTFTSGTTIDASGLMSATVVMLLPNGNSTIVNGMVNGNTWQVGYEFTQIGDYEAVLILTDSAGNRRYSPIWQFEVGSDPTVVRLLDIHVTGDRSSLPALVVTLVLLSGLIGLTLQFRSRLRTSRFR